MSDGINDARERTSLPTRQREISSKEVDASFSNGSEFKKWDQDKTSYLGMPSWIWWETLEVSKFGASRYGQRNWQECKDPSRYVDALHRHLHAVVMGEETDPDSGMPHLAHAMWNIAALRWLQNNKPELMEGLQEFL